ncbi:MAG: (2Fe-2S) ferredoxin domain-containing protein [Planctomycetota bacterium]|nr:(2Fe-2S) ferredoxin domain-containing protein [Planctomycetota bacterium]
MEKRIKTPGDLKTIREKVKAEIDVRLGRKEILITVHMGTCGIAAGARDILSCLMEELHKASIDYVTLKQSGCLGLCDKEPMMTLTDKDGKEFVYGKLDKNRIHEIVVGHVAGGKPVSEYLVK